jgi:hypothetical protein
MKSRLTSSLARAQGLMVLLYNNVAELRQNGGRRRR